MVGIHNFMFVELYMQERYRLVIMCDKRAVSPKQYVRSEEDGMFSGANQDECHE